MFLNEVKAGSAARLQGTRIWVLPGLYPPVAGQSPKPDPFGPLWLGWCLPSHTWPPKTPPKTHNQGAHAQTHHHFCSLHVLDDSKERLEASIPKASLCLSSCCAACSLLPVWLSLISTPPHAPSPTPASDLSPRNRNPLPKLRLLEREVGEAGGPTERLGPASFSVNDGATGPPKGRLLRPEIMLRPIGLQDAALIRCDHRTGGLGSTGSAAPSLRCQPLEMQPVNLYMLSSLGNGHRGLSTWGKGSVPLFPFRHVHLQEKGEGGPKISVV